MQMDLLITVFSFFFKEA